MKVALYVSRYKEENVQTPPGLQYLAGYLVGKGLVEESDILFADSTEQIIGFKPDVLGVGSVSQCFDDAVRVASEVRSAIPGCWNVMGGYHITALPKILPRPFHAGVIGEGEITFSELVSLRMKSSETDPALLGGIKGLCFRDEKDVITQTARRPLIEDIDSLPRPFRRLPYGQQWPYLFTARGCPYHCIYCASHAFWERYRFHSADYIVNEIETIADKLGADSIYFVDDLFIVPKKRLREIRNLIKERGLLGKVRFRGFVRANLVDEEVISILKELGFIEVRFGMETASERLLKYIKDQPFSVEQAESVIALCNKYEIPVCASFMFGIPGEEEEDIRKTRDFLRKHRSRFYLSGCYLIQPVPGAKLWDDCLAKGMVSQEMDFSSFELDLSRENLDWDRVLYLNGDKIPLPRFKEIMEDLRSEFTGQLKPEPAASGNNFTSPMGFFSSMSQKIKTIVKAMLSKAGYEIRRIPPEVTEKPQARKSGLRLYVGCGTDSRHGFEGCDTRPLPNVSIVCKAWEISRNCTEVKEIYSRHMLEHLTLPQVEETLRDWLCALAEGGRIHVVVPNMDFHVEQWRRAAWNEEEWNKQFSDARHSFAGFWGWQRESDSEALRQSGENAFWDIHKCGFNCEFLAFLLEREGFTNISCEVADDVHVVATALKPL